MFSPPYLCRMNAHRKHVSAAIKLGFHRQSATYCASCVAGPASTSQPLSHLRLMPLGGSVTHGVGSSDQSGYRKVLLQMLQGDGFNVQFVGSRKAGNFPNNAHEGWRGFRIDQIEPRGKASAEKLLPHVFTVNAGSNDCLQDYKPAEASERLGRLLETLWSASPASTIVLSSLIVNRDDKVDERIQAFNEEIQKLAGVKAAEGRKVVFVDMHGGDGPLAQDLVEDGTHPNDEGYGKMAKIWFRGIQAASRKEFLPTAHA